jgi:hypothetical protein
MDGFEKMSRDKLRSIVSKLKIMKYSDMLKLRKSELINVIKFKELFPFEESFFDETEGSSHEANKKKKVVRKVDKTEKLEKRPKIKTDECSICLDVIKYDKSILTCNHHFHFLCIFIWFRENLICPVCRQEYDIKFTRRGRVWVMRE